MRNLLLLGSLFFLISSPGLSQSSPGTEAWLVRLPSMDATALQVLQQAGIDLQCGARLDHPAEIELSCSGHELALIREAGIPCEVANVDKTETSPASRQQRLQAARRQLEALRHASIRSSSTACTARAWNIPVHFTLGGMGGFPGYMDIMRTLDTMAILYPELISPRRMISDSLSTHQGRPLYWVRISDHPELDEDEPEILYTALTHAREPASAMSLLYFMWYLLENYGQDPQITSLVEQTEMYFIPVVNPDGYLYNEQIAPDGGGMWRKNLRDNNGNGMIDDADGVDLNRNYGHSWGLDDLGSSPVEQHSTYRGPTPFSEPETRMIRDFTLAHQFRIAIHDHAYGDDLYYPWDHGPEDLPDARAFEEISEWMSRENRYLYGQLCETYWLGALNGGANDWFYGEQTTKPKIYSWLPEIGRAFWPDPAEIVGLCQQQLGLHVLAAQMAGTLIRISDLSPHSLDYGLQTLQFDLEHLGLSEDQISLTILPDHPGIRIHAPSEPVMIWQSHMETTRVNIQMEISREMEMGSSAGFVIEVSCHEGLVLRHHVQKRIGLPIHAMPFTAWTSAQWGVQTDPEGVESLTDSPDALQPEGRTIIELTEPLDLGGIDQAQITFLARWDIEPLFDFVQLQASVNGTTWTPLCGRFTKPGSPDSPIDVPSPYATQPEAEPIYDGNQPAWVREIVDLGEMTGQDQVFLRFVTWSGPLTGKGTRDGFAFREMMLITGMPVHCSDGMLNGDETEVDCGGIACSPCPSCTDSIMNGDEVGVDCGGSLCEPCPTCTDGIQNGDETGVDCGGACAACIPTCEDGIMNGDEEGIDCGGSCHPCRVKCCDRESKLAYQGTLPVTIFPNPASDRLMIAFERPDSASAKIVLEVLISDLTGRPLMYQERPITNLMELDISGLRPQVYLMRIRDSLGGVGYSRFVKVEN